MPIADTVSLYDQSGQLIHVASKYEISNMQPDCRLLEVEEREQVHGALLSLSNQEQEILKLRFGFSSEGRLTLERTAARLGISRSRVQQIEKSGKGKMLNILKYYYEGECYE